jgi:prepilin-type N-terminal cleavage/methylation domain-containing protein
VRKSAQSRSSSPGFTLVELIVVVVLLTFLLAIAVVHFRRMRSSSLHLATHINLRMDLRKASNMLTDTLLTGTEVVKPLIGGTTPFLVVQDLRNYLTILYLRKASTPDQGPNELVAYTDTLTGMHKPENVKVLFGKVKEVFFTPLSPGLVLVNFSLAGPNASELSTVLQVPLKNLGSVDE